LTGEAGNATAGRKWQRRLGCSREVDWHAASKLPKYDPDMTWEAKRTLNRRQVLAATAIVCAAGPAVAQPAEVSAEISARQAHAAAARGELVVVDVRTPYEWRATGIGEHVVPISMHEPGFIDRLDQLVLGDWSRRIALICAQGVRSSSLQRTLLRVGFSNVLDVAEGMEGGPNGPGWIAQGLPVQPVRP
jgi:rhodanese-related sulfurtransferase